MISPEPSTVEDTAWWDDKMHRDEYYDNEPTRMDLLRDL